jgi:recombination protein RecR
MNGIGPDDINAYSLIIRTQNTEIREVIFALSANMEGDTTTFYLTRKIKRNNLTITSIARGIPVGGELEFADEITLGRSLTNRTFYSIQSDVS